jgi:hypothetical protein
MHKMHFLKKVKDGHVSRWEILGFVQVDPEDKENTRVPATASPLGKIQSLVLVEIDRKNFDPRCPQVTGELHCPDPRGNFEKMDPEAGSLALTPVPPASSWDDGRRKGRIHWNLGTLCSFLRKASTS